MKMTTTGLAALMILSTAGCAVGDGDPALGTSGSALVDDQGPPCADITVADAYYNGSNVYVSVQTAAPSCAYADYRLEVLASDATGTATTPLATQSLAGDGTQSLSFSVAASGGAYVCIALTSSVGPHVADRAPNAGCFVLTPGVVGEVTLR